MRPCESNRMHQRSCYPCELGGVNCTAAGCLSVFRDFTYSNLSVIHSIQNSTFSLMHLEPKHWMQSWDYFGRLACSVVMALVSGVHSSTYIYARSSERLLFFLSIKTSISSRVVIAFSPVSCARNLVDCDKPHLFCVKCIEGCCRSSSWVIYFSLCNFYTLQHLLTCIHLYPFKSLFSHSQNDAVFASVTAARAH